jgi:aromatic ring hydroxylase
MRTGAEYREALRDGRRVWVIGEGLVEDVTVHPATRGTVDEYVAWYDRHFDREWQDVLLTPPDAAGARAPLSYIIPKSPQDLRAMGRCFSATTFLSAIRLPYAGVCVMLPALRKVVAEKQRPIARKSWGLFGMM